MDSSNDSGGRDYFNNFTAHGKNILLVSVISLMPLML